MSSETPKKSSKKRQKAVQAQLSLQSSILAHFLARDNHTQHSVAGAVCPPRDGHLFEYFFVVGAALERAAQIKRPAPHPVMVEPVILYQYPRAPPPPQLQSAIQQLPHFAFPSAVDVRALEPGGSLSLQQEILFGPLAAFERIGPSFVFLLSGSDTLLYGICVAKPEFVDVLPSMLAGSSSSAAAAAASAAPAPTAAAPAVPTVRAVTTRCYVFLTRFPFFHLHFEVMYSVLASERLDALQRMGGEVRARNAARAILKEYYKLPVPDEDKSSIFELSSTLHHVKFSSPTGHEDKLIGQWCLPPFACLLSLPNILTLLNAVMLERRIVFVSSNVGFLSACVLSVVPLLHPFIWQGTYVPVLPNHLREYLQAPVPYIMGVHEVPHKINEFRRTVDPATVVVLVDTNEIVMGGGKTPAADVLPPVPHADVITANLEPITTKLRAISQKKSCGTISAEIAATVAEFTHELTVYHNWLNGSIRKGLREFMKRRALAHRNSAPPSLAHSLFSHSSPSLLPDKPALLLATASLRTTLGTDTVIDEGSTLAPPPSPPPSTEPGAAVEPGVPVGAFDFDDIETHIDDLLQCFRPQHHAFLREFLLSQHFLFFATRVASATDKLTLVDHKLTELGALLRTRSPAIAKRKEAAPAAADAAKPALTTSATSRRSSIGQQRPNAALSVSAEPGARAAAANLPLSPPRSSKLGSLRANGSEDGGDDDENETDSETASDVSDAPVRRFSISSAPLPAAHLLLQSAEELEL